MNTQHLTMPLLVFDFGGSKLTAALTTDDLLAQRRWLGHCREASASALAGELW